ncbi:hypothetical protein CP970_21945 [Streptomyces kanamyceticus]|uniref:Uncharacterized protein n=1 Tax=Streptomyces kanamyceticus TaxID=1967 RepID=A0A5J6GDG8_STRKN|nr:hypothetical protein CP970_21945 [Streptomyces kanamyceticus]
MMRYADHQVLVARYEELRLGVQQTSDRTHRMQAEAVEMRSRALEMRYEAVTHPGQRRDSRGSR